MDPRRNWQAVVVHLGGGLFLLPQVVSASGAKCIDNQRSFWTNSDEAFLEVDGVIVEMACARTRSGAARVGLTTSGTSRWSNL
jgi:membrane-bound inhibitor of C-type lysozyme